MVDEGGSAPPITNSIDESNNDSSSNLNSAEKIGGNSQTQISSQISSSNSVYGKGLGKKPFDFEKMAEMYDKQNNVIDLIPGVGLFIDLLKIFFLFIEIKKKE
jgi:hypothetical protein